MKIKNKSILRMRPLRVRSGQGPRGNSTTASVPYYFGLVRNKYSKYNIFLHNTIRSIIYIYILLTRYRMINTRQFKNGLIIEAFSSPGQKIICTLFTFHGQIRRPFESASIIDGSNELFDHQLQLSIGKLISQTNFVKRSQ